MLFIKEYPKVISEVLAKTSWKDLGYIVYYKKIQKIIDKKENIAIKSHGKQWFYSVL